MFKNKQYLLHLHAHMPYVLETGVEYWLYEAVLHSYLPFLKMLSQHQDKKFSISLNLSPILLVQLESSIFQDGFQKYLSIRKEILSVNLKDETKNNLLKKEMEQLIELEQLYEQWDRNIIKGFQYFHKLSYLTITTSSATHAFLPSLKPFPYILKTQIALGQQISDHFFPDIKGFWSPECSVFPRLSPLLKEQDIQYCFTDPSVLLYEQRNHVFNSIFRHEGISYIIRDNDATMKIWDAHTGYPCHHHYKEFHKDLSEESSEIQEILKKHQLLKTGISIHRISSSDTIKELYSDELAKEQVQNDVKNYLNYLEKRFQDAPIINVCFDMELFGHWWKEGVDFLSLLIQYIGDSPISLDALPPTESDSPILEPLLSTWGTNNNAESWINGKTAPIWQSLIYANTEMEYYLKYNSPINENKLYNLLLAQASDWTFLITHNSFADYSKEKVLNHLQYPPLQDTSPNLLYKLICENY